MKWDCRARRKSRRPDTKASVLKLLVLVYERQILAIANICARCSRATTQVSACNPAKWDNSNGGPVPKPESNRCCWSGVPRDQDSQGKASVGAGCKRSFDPAPATKIESPWFIRIKGFSYWRSGLAGAWDARECRQCCTKSPFRIFEAAVLPVLSLFLSISLFSRWQF